MLHRVTAPAIAGFGGHHRQGIKTATSGRKLALENREKTHAVDSDRGFTRMIAQPTVLSPFSGKRDFAGRDKSAKTAP